MNPQTNEQLTFWQADSLDHANPIVLPGSEQARRMTVTSGLKCLELYRKQNQLGLLVKMLLTSSTWNSNERYLTWKAKGTTHRRLLFQLVASTANINEIEYLWSPTPQASDYRKVISTMGSCLRTLKATPELGTQEGWLNPEYSEWLMGFPTKWTDLEV